ncbi:MAG: serine--tRNA ligase [archaeon]
MLDINLIRANPTLAEGNLKKRNDLKKIALLQELIENDREWRCLKQEIDALRQKRNVISGVIAGEMRAGMDVSSKTAEAKQIPSLIKEKEARTAELKGKVDYCLMRLPNLLDDSVPFGKDESENIVVKKCGKPKKASFELLHHGMLAAKLGLADFERAVKISGNGFFYLKGSLVLLDLALQKYALDLLCKRGFMPVQPPFMMRRRPYEGVVSLDDFENVMYKIENDDLYLIATSEHPMAAMYQDEILEEKDLPIKYAGVSACFRREIGKHGLDERGFFRVHQFNKIEQFVFCTPGQSWKLFEEIAKNAEDLLKGLKIPYEKVNVCTGDMGAIAAKKYDFNGWSPREQKYIELMSCSHCTDYQARRLGIRYRKKGGEKAVVHTLNNTMVATTRMLRIILETYQTKQGTIKVPAVLQKYMNGLKEIKGNAEKPQKPKKGKK